MSEFDILTMMAVVIFGLHLLHQASQNLPLNRWLTPFNPTWILGALLWLMPTVEAGSKVSIALSYFLIGTLILNTLTLYLCSRLPEQVIPVKSTEIEIVGGTLLKLMGTGIKEIGRTLLIALFEMIDSILFSQQSRLIRPNAG
jgi:hypothetical protein